MPWITLGESPLWYQAGRISLQSAFLELLWLGPNSIHSGFRTQRPTPAPIVHSQPEKKTKVAKLIWGSKTTDFLLRASKQMLSPQSVQFSSVVFDSLRPQGLQHTRLPWPSPTPWACPNSCPLSCWCHPTLSSSVVPFSSRLQSRPASGSFSMSQFFASGGQSTGVSISASVLPMNIQDWFPLGWTGWISLQSKGLSRVFSNTTVQKHQFFSI